MSWKTQAQQIVFNAIQSAKNDNSDEIENLTDEVKSNVLSNLENPNVIGINANKIDSINNSIINYTNKINEHIIQLNNNDQDEYVDNIIEILKVLINQLLSFSNQLNEIKEEYNKYKEREI